MVIPSSAAIHTGPYGTCTTVGYVSGGTAVHYDCYSVNSYGNTWTWIRDGNGSSPGCGSTTPTWMTAAPPHSADRLRRVES
ncbi:hypothetical protein OHA98_31275 [Streptomyces sp. NBC_00654]|uniref:hypothetical protein n=1 Tax=Streptomyces sp. NBC_00654 TaxID=2975799 RepID=UPI00225074A0|nr:hypothetical protein [Streptomyces sp. NBC_00654]MCX4969159.1 hypothetical protein [Streptomyces sp. NBC_00654]